MGVSLFEQRRIDKRGGIFVADLTRAYQVDLGPDHGAIRQVIAQQRQAFEVAGRFEIAIDQAPRPGGFAARMQVHREKRELVEHVDPAELIVEFDAVEEHDASVDERDVGQVEITVAFPHETAIQPPRKYLAKSVVLRFQPGSVVGERSAIVVVLEQWCYLRDVLTRRFGNGLQRAEALVGSCDGDGAMKIDDALCYRIDRPGGQPVACQDAIESGRLVEAAHQYRMFYRTACAGDLRTFGTAGNRYDPQIQVRRRSSVQAQFLVAVEQA